METDEPTKEVVDAMENTSLDKTSSAMVTYPRPSSRPVPIQSPSQPGPVKHRKPIRDYEVSLKWERDGTVKDYVHRKDPVKCKQCRDKTHTGVDNFEDIEVGGIVLRYSKYQKESQADAPLSPPNGTTNGTTENKQAAAVTVPTPRKPYYLSLSHSQLQITPDIQGHLSRISLSADMFTYFRIPQNRQTPKVLLQRPHLQNRLVRALRRVLRSLSRAPLRDYLPRLLPRLRRHRRETLWSLQVVRGHPQAAAPFAVLRHRQRRAPVRG